jgi:acetyltransferase-like isoleucine patch superfamily enzyme
MIKRIIRSVRDALLGNSRNIHATAFIPDTASLAVGVSIGAKVKVGEYTYINSQTQVSSGQIGSYCSIGSFCEIGPDSHPLNWISTSPNYYKNNSTTKESYKEPKSAPVIGNDVWIGSHAVVLRGVVIGQGAVIGAGAIVTKDVDCYEIVVGIPAKHLRYRFTKLVIDKLINENIFDKKHSKKKNSVLADKMDKFDNFL